MKEEQKIQWPHYKEVLADNSALWADQYALTMSQALFAEGKYDLNTTFHAFIRKTPFNGSYLLTAGQNIVFEWLQNNWKFDETDLEILRQETVLDLQTGEQKRLYTDEFLDMLGNSKLELTIDAMPEGEIAFPDEPIMRINGPVWQCLMVEAAVLNCINSQSLYATLASRICKAADGDDVLELGLRRSQALGGLEATRGSYIGGITATSNMLAKKHYGIPSSGTMAHAFVMLHESELEAFAAYAKNMPHNNIHLIDTYDSLQGIENAAKTCKDLGLTLKAVRLDSGDLANLSIEGRKILDDYGFNKAKIAASNDLDENEIVELKKKGAPINVWGIGTKLVTSEAQPALGGVYKLGAVHDYHRKLDPSVVDDYRESVRKGLTGPDYTRDVIKLSGDEIKTSIPGELDVIRALKQDADGHVRFAGDTIVDYLDGEYLQDQRLVFNMRSIKKSNMTVQTIYPEGTTAYQPLQRIFDKGELVGQIETVHDARERARIRMDMLEDNIKELTGAKTYNVGLEESLYKKRQAKILTSAVPHFA